MMNSNSKVNKRNFVFVADCRRAPNVLFSWYFVRQIYSIYLYLIFYHLSIPSSQSGVALDRQKHLWHLAVTSSRRRCYTATAFSRSRCVFRSCCVVVVSSSQTLCIKSPLCAPFFEHTPTADLFATLLCLKATPLVYPEELGVVRRRRRASVRSHR